ncbi:hmgb1 protein [Lynx pardinus]|uniref:Hmgb1 protein n=1 Tax=Lynx pardinus TaxID=191816 RepID=A0A485N2L4_LYNPA|nr:hmgb1 protein [Lynx pardinus]
MSTKEKGKVEDMAKADKAHYEREMKIYIPSKGKTKKKFKDPNVPNRPPLAFLLFCSEYQPKTKGEDAGLSYWCHLLVTLQRNWERCEKTVVDDKQSYDNKAAKLKEKYKKDITA